MMNEKIQFDRIPCYDLGPQPLPLQPSPPPLDSMVHTASQSRKPRLKIEFVGINLFSIICYIIFCSKN